MATSDYSYIRSVMGLLIPCDADLGKVAEALEEYISLIPELTDKLKENAFSMNTNGFVTSLEAIIAILKEIFARRLESTAFFLFKEARKGNISIYRGEISEFVTDLLSLSIDTQISKARQADKMTPVNGKLEEITDTVNNLSAVERLIRDQEYDKAYDIVSNMTSLEEDISATKLMKAVSMREYDRIGALAKELKEQYIKRIVINSGSAGASRRVILTVDDRPEILNSVSLALKGYYKVLGAPSGQVALKILERNTPDLFLLDIEMPFMNGFQLAILIRCMKQFAETPILFLTSNVAKEYVLKAIASGADDFIVKPAASHTLIAKVSKFLS